MAEFNQNLWAPWRMEYIQSLHGTAKKGGCFLCQYWSARDRDADNNVVWRTATTFVVLNRYPYTNGHLLVAHAAHKADPTDLTDEELAELSRTVRDAVAVVRRALAPQGFNIGFNLGECAGAGLPGHLHAHVVPRWAGDTNFMAVIGDSRVVPESLETVRVQLIQVAEEAGLVP